jgi:hypothetical protein
MQAKQNPEQPLIQAVPTTLSSLLYGNASALPLFGEKLFKTVNIEILANIETLEKGVMSSTLDANRKSSALNLISAAIFHSARCEFEEAYKLTFNLYNNFSEIYLNNPNLTAIFNLTLAQLANKANLDQTLSHVLKTKEALEQVQASLPRYNNKILENLIIAISAIDKEPREARNLYIHSHIDEVMKRINAFTQQEILDNLDNLKNLSNTIIATDRLSNFSKEKIINSIFKLVSDENLNQFLRSDPTGSIKLNLTRGLLITYLAKSCESTIKPYDSKIADIAKLLIENPTKFPLLNYSDFCSTAKLAFDNDLFDEAYEIFTNLTRNIDLTLLQNKDVIIESFIGSMKSSYKSNEKNNKTAVPKIKEYALKYFSGYPTETLMLENAFAEIILEKHEKGELVDENLQLIALTLEGLCKRQDIAENTKNEAFKTYRKLNEILSQEN